MRLIWIAAFAAGLWAQDSISRQAGSVTRQRDTLAMPGQSLYRQQGAASRQAAAAARQRREDQAAAAPELAAWIPRLRDPACRSLETDIARAHFQDEEQREGLPAGLLEAVALQESALNPCAVSPAGALGLMQLMPATAGQFGVSDPLDPWQSLQAGGQFLKLLLDRYGGNLNLALGAYNAGPARVDLYGGVPPIPETQNYVESVLTRMKRITASDNQPPP